MNYATKAFASTFCTVMALAGIEHGIGEICQGSAAPSGVMILSWPESQFFQGLGGEPAMTVIPNLLVTGVLAVLVSLALLLWSVRFAHRKNAGWVMIFLSAVMLPVGGGIFPPLLGILIGAAATRIHSPLTWWSTHLSPGARRSLAGLWPWSFTACIIAWLALLPGVPLLEYFSGLSNPAVILLIIFIAFATLGLTSISGFARDIQYQNSSRSFTQSSDPQRMEVLEETILYPVK